MPLFARLLSNRAMKQGTGRGWGIGDGSNSAVTGSFSWSQAHLFHCTMPGGGRAAASPRGPEWKALEVRRLGGDARSPM